MEYLTLICALLPMAAAAPAYLLRRRGEKGDAFTSLVCLLTLACAALIAVFGGGRLTLPGVMILGLSFEAGGYKSLFGLLCALMFFLSSLANTAYFRGEPHSERYDAFLLLTLGGVLGVFYAGDLFTVYVFFETMSVASWVWVAHNETKEAQRAADTYLGMAMIGGLTMLYGLIALNSLLGTLDLAALPEAVKAADHAKAFAYSLCLLVGFGVKAGMFPFHVWLPKAHPVAPAPSSALLSGILTKTGVCGILMTVTSLLWGDGDFSLLLLLLGAVTMVLGALLAVFSIDLKRTLACSSLSQIGFILVGAAMLATGEETSLAAGGVMLHAVNHGLIKTVLFLTAGVIYAHRRTLDLNQLKGCGRSSTFLKLCFLTGALAIAGVPGFGGYVSKTLLHEAIVEHANAFPLLGAEGMEAVEWIFLISGGLTAAYMTKLFVKLFAEKPDEPMEPIRPDGKTSFAIGLPACLLVIMGLLPDLTYEKLAAFTAASLNGEAFRLSYFSLENLKGAAISLCIGAAVYIVFIRGLLTEHRDGSYRKATTVLDLESDVYRPLLELIAFLGALAARVAFSLTDWCVALCTGVMNFRSSDRVTPGEDRHFGRYSEEYVKVGAITQTLQFELMLFGLGVVFTLLYLLFF